MWVKTRDPYPLYLLVKLMSQGLQTSAAIISEIKGIFHEERLKMLSLAPSKAPSKWGWVSVSRSLFAIFPNSLAQTQNKDIVCKAYSRVSHWQRGKKEEIFCFLLRGAERCRVFCAVYTHTRARAFQRSQSDSKEVSRASEWVSGDIAAQQEFSYLAPGLRWRAESWNPEQRRRDTRRSLSDPSAEIKPLNG
jgi:hypothetical protein